MWGRVVGRWLGSGWAVVGRVVGQWLGGGWAGGGGGALGGGGVGWGGGWAMVRLRVSSLTTKILYLATASLVSLSYLMDALYLLQTPGPRRLYNIDDYFAHLQ